MKLLKSIIKNKIWFSILLGLLIVLTVSNIYLIKNILLLTGIENIIRLFSYFILFIFEVLFILFAIKILIKNKLKSYIIYLFIIIIYTLLISFVGYNINKVYSAINNISTSNTLYSTSIVTLKDNDASNINDIGLKTIGILNDESSIDGYEIAMEIIEEENLSNTIKYYDGYTDLLDALLNGEIEYIFLPTNYGVMFSNIDSYENIEEETKIIYTKEKEVAKENVSNNSSITEPFTILVMGVDSEKEDIKGASFNGDALMLITFNPNTLTATMLSIPRDTYVPIACFKNQRKNKITHAAWYGEDCMIDTIENFTGIEIDYYLKINFKGVVNLVDALGGVTVDVPYSFCEQDSNRSWDDNTVYVEEGIQTLNGEQVLALARNRHPNPSHCSSEWTDYNSNDFVRGQNQQLIIKAILNKVKSISSLDTVYKLLETISNSMETNMTTNEILSFYNIGKDILAKSSHSDIEDIITIQRLYLSGYDQYIYDYSMISKQGTKQTLYNFIPYQGSIDDVVEAMNINLGLADETVVKNFSFDVEDEYEEFVIGKGYYNESAIAILPNFIGDSESVARTYANKYNITLNVEYITATSDKYEVGEIVDQTTPSGMDTSYVTELSIVVVNQIETEEEEEINCSLEENADNSACIIPNFVGSDYSTFTTWKNKYSSLSIRFVETEIEEGDEDYDEDQQGIIVYQSINDDSIYTLIGNVFEIKYIAVADTPSTDTAEE
ncbi:MAG: LCP family protein [Bacilli bacterium]|nr:LCP family protein [Bacilli bacterium]